MINLNRRSFGKILGSSLCLSAFPSASDAAPSSELPPLIIDGLGGISDPNQQQHDNPFGKHELVLSDRGIMDALSSGLNAVNVTLGYVAGEENPFEHTIREISQWNAAIRQHSDRLMKVYDASDIDLARKTGRIGIIFGFQNAAQIGDDLDRIDIFANLGVKIIQLTYNDKNQIGSGAIVPGDKGLSEFGRSVISRMNEKNLLVDTSHGGAQTILEAIEQSTSPITISHTGCRALADLPRNVSDATLKKLADKGGVAGIYFMPFLNKGPQPYAEAVVRHIEHAINIAGEDHVGIGTDNPVTGIDDMPAYRKYIRGEIAKRAKLGVSAPGENNDIVPMIPDLQGIDKFRKLSQMLDQRGHSASRIEKILGRNFYRLMKEVWA